MPESTSAAVGTAHQAGPAKETGGGAGAMSGGVGALPGAPGTIHGMALGGQATGAGALLSHWAEAAPVQRKLVHDTGTPPHVIAVEFTVGQEVSLTLASKAHHLAAGGIDDGKLRALRTEALADETISDNERMFLAGLLDPVNARAVAAARIAAGTKLQFSRASIEAHMAHARDLDKKTIDPAIAAKHAAARQRAAAYDPVGEAIEETGALQAALNQMLALVGPTWRQRVSAAAAYGLGRVPAEAILEAMLAAASDDTEGDRAMAAVVYVVAAMAGNPMANQIRTGRIKIDQVSTPGSNGELATYRGTAGVGGKGDTIKVPGTFDINDVGHRSAIIHELSHAADDAAAAGPRVGTIAHDQAELKAYRAGARYQLDQAAGLTGMERMNAVAQIGALLNEISMLALVLESRRQPARFVPVIQEANEFMSTPLAPGVLARLVRLPDETITRETLKIIGKAYGALRPDGTPVPGGNDLPVDGLSGEGILAWIDRS